MSQCCWEQWAPTQKNSHYMGCVLGGGGDVTSQVPHPVACIYATCTTVCHLHYCAPGCYIRGHTHPFPSSCCHTAGAPSDRSQYCITGGLYIYQGHKGCVDGGSIFGSSSGDETRRPSELHGLCATAQHCLGTRSPHLSLLSGPISLSFHLNKQNLFL